MAEEEEDYDYEEDKYICYLCYSELIEKDQELWCPECNIKVMTEGF